MTNNTCTAPQADFEGWLRIVCFQKPAPEAYDLAKCAWNEAASRHRLPEGWVAEAAQMLDSMHYLSYSWGFEAGKVGEAVDTTIAGNKAGEAMERLWRHIYTARPTLASSADAGGA